MSDVKIFKIKGIMKKPFEALRFTREIAALRKEHALEKLYSEMGSRHKVRRRELVIESVEEISPGKG